jgi:hypothetical protein
MKINTQLTYPIEIHPDMQLKKVIQIRGFGGKL